MQIKNMFRNLPKQANLIIFLLLISTLFIGCGNTKQSALSMAADSGDTSNSLSRPQRIDIFEEVWKTINEQFYDPSFNGVNWKQVHEQYMPKVDAAKSDVEFYRLFEEMLALLLDSHTVFIHPESNESKSINPPGSVGISLGEAEGKTVITEVEPESDADQAGVKQGMVLRSVNGRSVEELYAEIRSRFAGSSTEQAMKGVMHRALLYGGFLGPTRKFEVEGFDSKIFGVTVTHFGARPSETPKVTASRLSSNIGYIKFDGWKPPADEQFKTELTKLIETNGLIIDLRGNGGGQTSVQLNIGSLFFPSETNFGSFKKRGGLAEQIITHKSDLIYRGNVVVLVDETSASASEVFAAAMQESKRAIIIGRQTCGCVLNSWSKQVKGGGTLRWSARVYTSLNNRRLEGIGIVPDNTIPLTISDLRQGRDAALEAAKNVLIRH